MEPTNEQLRLPHDLARDFMGHALKELVVKNGGPVEVMMMLDCVLYVSLLALEDFFDVERPATIEMLNQLTLGIEERLARQAVEKAGKPDAKQVARAFMEKLRSRGGHKA